jgi:hypothetical protein
MRSNLMNPLNECLSRSSLRFRHVSTIPDFMAIESEIERAIMLLSS